ncbi:MAG: YihY/virulence factor BrkB family protein [Hyphomicrobiaceae bacterium]
MWSVLKTAASDWLRHRDARLGAALAYYSVFSLGPLLLIVVGLAGLLFGRETVATALNDQIRALLGPTGSQAVNAMLEGAGTPAGGAISTAVGTALLLMAALGVVVQLKDALNTIWDTKEPEHAGIWSFLRAYLISFAGILGLGFLLAVSLVISTALAALTEWIGTGDGALAASLNFTVSLIVLAALFTMLFKWFPDADVAWRDASWGGAFTALLFNVGKLAISWYIGMQGLESTYGAAASLVILLIWIYYSAQIVLFGAEITHVLSRAAHGGEPARVFSDGGPSAHSRAQP